MNRARAEAFLLLFAAAFVAKAYATGPTFHDILHKQYAFSGKSSSKSTVTIAAIKTPAAEESISAEAYAYDYGGVEEKEICLQEITRRNCVYTGPDTATTGSEMWTSDLACCKDYKLNYGGWNHGNSIGLSPFSNAVGSCDWTAVYPNNVGTVVSPGVTRLGGISAVCYLGADASECGFPTCERMVLTLQGSVYDVANAYSHYGSTNTNDAGCQAIWTSRPTTGGNRVMGTNPNAGPVPTSNGTTQVGNVAQGPNKQPAATPKAPNHAQVQTANYYDTQTLNYGGGYGDYGHHTTEVINQGRAIIISGMVSAVVGKHKEKWEGGMFEYVPSFIAAVVNTAAPGFTGLDATLPWIRDNTIKLTLYRSGGYYEGSSGSK